MQRLCSQGTNHTQNTQDDYGKNDSLQRSSGVLSQLHSNLLTSTHGFTYGE